jgi:hypothetical protein
MLLYFILIIESNSSRRLCTRCVSYTISRPEVNADMPVNEQLLKTIERCRNSLSNSMKASIFSAAGIPNHLLKVSNTPSQDSTGSKLTRESISHKIPHLPTPDVHFSVSMTALDRSQVANFLTTIKTNNHKYFGELCNPGHLKRFVKHNTSTNDYTFLPQLFLEPLRSHVEFLDTVVHTQHFMSFVEKRRQQYVVLEQSAKVFLTEWLYFRMYMIKRKRQQWPPRTKKL